jgi:hypothetical protein
MDTDPLMGRESKKKRKADQSKGYYNRMKEVELRPGDLRHGTSTGYRYCKCRCKKCMDWAEANPGKGKR